MKIVLAGGTGYLGELLVRALGQHGHQIVVLSRDGTDALSGPGRTSSTAPALLSTWLDGA